MPIRPISDGEEDEVIALWRGSGLVVPWNDPRADLNRARMSTDAEILVAEAQGSILATVMVGHDGHRGWVYYLAVRDDRRRTGLGQEIMAAAEDWVRERGMPKIQLMVRETNQSILDFYDAVGYGRQSVVVMGKWLDQ